MDTISKAERDYIRGGSAAGVREDGRRVDEFRCLEVERDVIPQVNGSSHVKIQDSVEVLCSVKLDVAEPDVAFPESGRLSFNVEMSPSCGLTEDKRLMELSSDVANHLQHIYMGCHAIDLHDLCIIKGKYCWAMHIDVVVLRCDGYPLDACSIAAYEALQCTILPKVLLKLGDSGVPETFEVQGDVSDSSYLKADRVPICLSVAKIGHQFLSDLTYSELLSVDCFYVVAVDNMGNFCGSVKADGGVLSPTEIIDILNAGQGFLSNIRTFVQ